MATLIAMMRQGFSLKMMNPIDILKTIWTCRGFIFGSVKREFQSKYINSMLGAAWTIINPLAMIVVYTVIFSQLMKAKLPGVSHGFAYSIYLCAGVVTWGLFSEVVGRCQNVFIDSANLLKKISFPRMSLPVIVVMSSCINFAIIFGLFLLFLIFWGFWPGWPVVSFLPVLLIQLLFATGLGMVLGVMNVFFRDVGQFFSIFLQFWFWFTPIVYPVSVLPSNVQSLMVLNPLFPLIQAYQNIFVSHAWPDWLGLLYPLTLGLLLCLLGFKLFRQHVGEMVDEL